MKNTLTSLALAGTLALSLTGCQHPEYYYNGEIDGENLVYKESGEGNNLKRDLNLTKKDGTRIIYHVEPILFGGFELDSVTIIKNGETNQYFNDKVGHNAILEAQKQFDAYRKNILEVKRQKAMRDVTNNVQKIELEAK